MLSLTRSGSRWLGHGRLAPFARLGTLENPLGRRNLSRPRSLPPEPPRPLADGLLLGGGTCSPCRTDSKPSDPRMNPRVRATVAYAPALALVVVGLIALTSSSGASPPSCTCTPGPNGTVCPPCAPVAVPTPLGPFLLVAAGIYTLAMLLVRLTLRLNRPARG